MLTIDTIHQLLHDLNDELKACGTIGEIGLCGGAVMCLVFNAREATKDIDAVFEPTQLMRKAARKVADKHQLPHDWLNDAAKGFFISNPPRIPVASYSHLRVWAPSAEYMLAMKCIAARFDSHDRDDVIFLVRHLALDSVESAQQVIEQYYPRQSTPEKTQFLLEELFETTCD